MQETMRTLEGEVLSVPASLQAIHETKLGIPEAQDVHQTAVRAFAAAVVMTSETVTRIEGYPDRRHIRDWPVDAGLSYRGGDAPQIYITPHILGVEERRPGDVSLRIALPGAEVGSYDVLPVRSITAIESNYND